MHLINSIFTSINTADLIAVIIILIFGVIGLINGFIFSVFKITAFLASVFIAIKFYPSVSEILSKFGMKANIQKSVAEGIMRQKEMLIPDAGEGAQKGTSFLESLRLPDFLKKSISSENMNLENIIDFDTFAENISTQLSQVVVDILALIILFILARLALSLLKTVLTGVAKLPVFKQVDMAGGLAFGLIEGILMIYIVCTVLLIFSSSQMLAGVFKSIEESRIANYFYEKNLIAGFLFPNLTQ